MCFQQNGLWYEETKQQTRHTNIQSNKQQTDQQQKMNFKEISVYKVSFIDLIGLPVVPVAICNHQ